MMSICTQGRPRIRHSFATAGSEWPCEILCLSQPSALPDSMLLGFCRQLLHLSFLYRPRHSDTVSCVVPASTGDSETRLDVSTDNGWSWRQSRYFFRWS